MATIHDIGFILYNGFRPYVPKSKLQKYDDEFASKKRYSSKFLLMVFPKYINEKTWMKKPKEKRDTYLFNYYYMKFQSMVLSILHCWEGMFTIGILELKV